MRFPYSTAAGAVLLFTAMSAHATPIVYNLTLTAISDTSGDPLANFNGTGTITLSTAPSATGLTNEGSAPVTFLIDGEMFSGTATNVQFLNGAFYNASFSEQIGTSPNRFDLQTSGVYAFYYADEHQAASGNITSSLAAPSSVTPEPSSFALLGSGLLGAAGVLKRRWA